MNVSLMTIGISFLHLQNKNRKSTHTKICVCGISKKYKKVTENIIFLKIYIFTGLKSQSYLIK